MKIKPRIEPGTTAAGVAVFRFVCEDCSPHRVGVWLKDLNVVEKNAATHVRACHPQPAVA